MRSLLTLLLIFTTMVEAQPERQSGVREIVITGTVPGPPLWEVRNGDNSLMVFGLLSPLPKNMMWDSSRVERAIDNADVVIRGLSIRGEEDVGVFGAVSLYRQYRRYRRSMPGDTLEDVLPPELFDQFMAVKEDYGPWGNSILKLRPLMAAEKLQSHVLNKVGLSDSNDIAKQIWRLVDRSDIESIGEEFIFDMPYSELLTQLDLLPMEVEMNCLATVLDSLETDLIEMEQRARSWANGYVGELYAMQFPNPQESCTRSLLSIDSFGDLAEDAKRHRLATVEQALVEYENSFMVLEMHELTSPDGLLDALRIKGYEIIEP